MDAASSAADARLIITSVEPSSRHPRRVVVSVGHKPVATLSTKLAEQLQLAPGVVWTQALAQRVRQAVAYDQGLSRATRMLARRPLSRKRLLERLTPRIPSTELRDQVMARLETLGLVDDVSLGRQYLEELVRKHPAGPLSWRQKLLAQGLEESLVERLLAETAKQTDSLAMAHVLAEKKMRAWRGLTAKQQRRRLYSLLARRGFEEEIVMQTVDRWVADDVQDDE